jgi:hypothetical protein
VAERYTGPDFAADALACFTHLRGPLRAMGLWIVDDGEISCVSVCRSNTEDEVEDVSSHSTYASAVSAAFLWAMDNQPDALRRACDSLNNGESK